MRAGGSARGDGRCGVAVTPFAPPLSCSFEAKYWTGRVDSAACSVRFVPDDGPSNAMPTRVVVGSMDGAITLFDTRMFGHLCRLRRPLPRGELFSVRTAPGLAGSR